MVIAARAIQHKIIERRIRRHGQAARRTLRIGWPVHAGHALPAGEVVVQIQLGKQHASSQAFDRTRCVQRKRHDLGIGLPHGVCTGSQPGADFMRKVGVVAYAGRHRGGVLIGEKHADGQVAIGQTKLLTR